MTRRKRVFKSCIDGQICSLVGASVILPVTLPVVAPATLSASSSIISMPSFAASSGGFISVGVFSSPAAFSSSGVFSSVNAFSSTGNFSSAGAFSSAGLFTSTGISFAGFGVPVSSSTSSSFSCLDATSSSVLFGEIH